MDDLVKQALADRIKEHDAAFTNLHREYDRRGDRIEELEANINIKADFIDATINQLAASDQRIEELEAKLGEYNLLWQTYELDKVVAVLKGQNDE